MLPPEIVHDPGPIPYARMALCGDPDLERALREDGWEPSETTYRLIEVPLSAIADTASMPWPAPAERWYVAAVEAGQEFPPVVVVRNVRNGWAVLDGANRTYAYWTLGKSRIRAYELLAILGR